MFCTNTLNAETTISTTKCKNRSRIGLKRFQRTYLVLLASCQPVQKHSEANVYFSQTSSTTLAKPFVFSVFGSIFVHVLLSPFGQSTYGFTSSSKVHLVFLSGSSQKFMGKLYPQARSAGQTKCWGPQACCVDLRTRHISNKKQCSRQLQCEVPCSVGNVANSSLFINSFWSSLSSASHAVLGGGLAEGGVWPQGVWPWGGGVWQGEGGLAGRGGVPQGGGGQGTFWSSYHYCITTWCFAPKGLRTLTFIG